MFETVVVANRGECAIRIIHTLKKLGIWAVAVYTEDDKSSRHVREADAAYQISDYMDILEILRVVRKCKAGAVHPGWGFKSEDPRFPKECARKGVVFIGPTEEVMENAGNKELARNEAEELGVPVIFGSPSEIRTRRSLKKWARDNGLSDEEDSVTFMLKAVAGAGGGGNEKLYRLGDFDQVIAEISGRSMRRWKNQRVFLERYIESGRHIEVQFVRYLDSAGMGCILIFGTRECSVQWMYQKVVEVAPAPNLVNHQESVLYAYTRLLVERMNYVGVGTVEFLVALDERIYFLEINPRLQVEHGVSELITGFDLVELGVRIAQGETLSVSQDEVQISGYAVEVRVNTQTINPQDHKTPIATTGTITGVILPNGGFVRVDHSLDVGYEVNVNYSSTQAKIMAWGATYTEAIDQVLEALEGTRIEGVETNIPLLKLILKDPTFRRGEHDSTFFPRLLEELAEKGGGTEEDTIKELVAAIAVGVAVAVALAKQMLPTPASPPVYSHWRYTARREGLRSDLKKR